MVYRQRYNTHAQYTYDTQDSTQAQYTDGTQAQYTLHRHSTYYDTQAQYTVHGHSTQAQYMAQYMYVTQAQYSGTLVLCETTTNPVILRYFKAGSPSSMRVVHNGFLDMSANFKVHHIVCMSAVILETRLKKGFLY